MAGLSNHFDTMTAIKAAIDALALTDMTGGVQIQEASGYLDGKVALPFVSISPFGPEVWVENTPVSLNGWDYPTLVVIYANTEVNSLELRLSWRQKIRNKIANHSVPSLGENFQFVIKPGPIIEVEQFLKRKAFVSSMIVMAKFQERRIA